jgi:hypothetical protein
LSSWCRHGSRRGGAAAAGIRAGEQVIFAANGNHAVILPISGKKLRSIYSLIETAKLNGLDPQCYLTDVLARIADHPARQITELPWHWKPAELQRAA